MKANILIALVLIVAGFPAVSEAGQATSDFGVCLVDSLTGKERKNLAKWIFFGIASHPEIADYSNISSADVDASDRFVGSLVTRLITEDCPAKAKAALDEGGSKAFEEAFNLVGRVAMQELMTDPAVSRATSGFEKYMDKEKFKALDRI